MMGGHGGLNILPQKKWNVYGRENRLRVARDEEAAAGKEREKLEEENRREKEARYRALLEKQRIEPVVIDCVGLTNDSSKEEGHDVGPDVYRVRDHPSHDAENVAATRQRGDPKTQTSDSRFDASFKFAKGMESTPWWVCDKRETNSEEGAKESEKRKSESKRSCLGYVKVKHGSKKSIARERKKQKKEMYEALRRERLEREALERKRMNSMISN